MEVLIFIVGAAGYALSLIHILPVSAFSTLEQCSDVSSLMLNDEVVLSLIHI